MISRLRTAGLMEGCTLLAVVGGGVLLNHVAGVAAAVLAIALRVIVKPAFRRPPRRSLRPSAHPPQRRPGLGMATAPRWCKVGPERAAPADTQGETPMTTNRRAFIAGGTAGLAAAAAPGPAQAQSQPPAMPAHPFEMPRNLTLLTFTRDGKHHLGIKTARGILDVAAAATALALPAPADMDDLLQNGRGALLRPIVERAPPTAYLDEATLTYGPVVTRPQKIIMMGFNYRTHAAETGTPVPADPPLFNKFNNALNHHGGTIRLPTKVAKEFDYEIELVIVFGRQCRDVSEADALDYVAGYCTGNDFSARDLQRLTSQFMIGKAHDGFAPIGPYLVTSDLVGDPNNLRIETRVNGEQRQDWNTNDMIFNCRQLISFASKMMTIQPGDIFFTGTPQGVILGMPKDKRVWLKPGDKIACSVEKLGELRFDLA